MSGWSPPSREELEVERRADIASPHMQIEWAPGKALAAAFGAGVAFTTAFAAAMAFVVAHFLR
jgi:hypothetical protein